MGLPVLKKRSMPSIGLNTWRSNQFMLAIDLAPPGSPSFVTWNMSEMNGGSQSR